ncbi:MAG: iron ABC transporter permease [Beijerinckiaceae bacterium]|nr:iron ABC transporter permease [Beijerinckiaceae bacterium]
MNEQRISSPWFWLAAAALVIVAVFLAYPLLNVILGSFGRGATSGWQTLTSDPKYAAAIGNTLLLGSGVTVLSLVLGVPLAYFAARYEFPGQSIIALLPLITLIIPEVIAAQTWLMLFGNNGIFTKWAASFGFELPSFYGWFGLFTVMSFTYYTYIYIGTLAAIRGADVQLEEAAQSLGTSPFQSRLRVLLPVILPSVLASALLVFTLVVGNFAVAMILSHKIPLLSVLTYQAAVAESGSDPVMQSTLATISVAIVMIVLFVQRVVLARGRYETIQGRGARPIRLRGLVGFAIGALAGLLTIISLMPLATLVVGAFTRARGPVMRWGEWSFANLERVLINAPDPIINTLIYAALATVLGIIFATLLSVLIVKKRTMLTPLLDSLAMLPLALSGTVIGIGLVMSFNSGFLALTGTGAIIVLAYIVRRLPFGVRNASSTLYNIPDSIEEASISLGVPPIRSFLNVVLPLMIPAILAATVLTWTTTVAELSASIIVYSGGRETLPIKIFRLIDSGLMAQASAYGLILIAIIIIPIIVATRIGKVDLFASRS